MLRIRGRSGPAISGRVLYSFDRTYVIKTTLIDLTLTEIKVRGVNRSKTLLVLAAVQSP